MMRFGHDESIVCAYTLNDSIWMFNNERPLRKNLGPGTIFSDFITEAFASPAATTAVDTTASKPLNIIIGDILLKDFDIVYNDGVTGITSRYIFDRLEVEMDVVDLDAMKFTASQGIIDNGRFDIYQVPIPVNPNAEATPLPFLAFDELTLHNVNGKYTGTEAGIVFDFNFKELYAEIPKANFNTFDIDVNKIDVKDSKLGIHMTTVASPPKSVDVISGSIFPAFNIQINDALIKNTDIAYTVDGATYSTKTFNPNALFLKNVNFEATQINTNIINETDVSPDDLDSFFNSQKFNAGDFQLLTFRSGQADPLKPQLYIGEQFINAVYSNLEYKFSKKLQMLVGVRGEAINQFIDYDTSVDVGNNKLEEFQILPSLALKYSPNESSNIKFAASKTYTLPQFKERAPFQYVEVTQIKIGNQFLKSSTDYNLDLGFEYFPEKLGVVSFTTFGKFIQNPINEFVKASATNDITFANTGALATVFGAEFELKLNVLPLFNKDADDKDEKFSFGLNASFMQTNQDLDEDKVRNENPGISADFTDKEQRLTGASDWLANADITYFKEFKENLNVQATLTFNYASDRIYALGTNNRGNLVDSQTNSLDFIFKSTISRNLELGFSVKNILNPTIERIQETQNVVVNSYNRGVNSGFSLSYKF